MAWRAIAISLSFLVGVLMVAWWQETRRRKRDERERQIRVRLTLLR